MHVVEFHAFEVKPPSPFQEPGGLGEQVSENAGVPQADLVQTREMGAVD